MMVLREEMLNRLIKTIEKEFKKKAKDRIDSTTKLTRAYSAILGLKRKRYDRIKSEKTISYEPKTTFSDGNINDKSYVQEIWSLGKKYYPSSYEVPVHPDSKDIYAGNFEFPRLLAGSNSEENFLLHEESNRRGGILNRFIKKDRWYCGYAYKGIGAMGKPISFKRYDITYPSGKVDGGFYKYWAVEEYRLNKRATDFGAFCQHPAGVYDLNKAVAGRPLAAFVRLVSSPIRMSNFLRSGGFAPYLTIRYGNSDISSFKKYIAGMANIIADNLIQLNRAGVLYGEFDIRNITSEGEFCDFEPAFRFDIVDGAAPLMHKSEFFTTIKSSFKIMEEFCRHISVNNRLCFSRQDAMRVYKEIFIKKMLSSFNVKSSSCSKSELARRIVKYGIER